MIKVRTIIEVLGAPKEHVEEVMKMIETKLKEENEVKILKSGTAPAQVIELKEAKNKDFFSSFTEFELEVPNLARLIGLCFDYMPSSVEILEPDAIDFYSDEAASIINDLLERLHRYDMLVKNLNAENTILRKKLE